MIEFAKNEWERAWRTLASARLLVASDPDSAASRAYYAAFHAVSALFALRGRTFAKHAALRAAVHRDLVQNGSWDPDLGKAFDYLLELRETADYGGPVSVTSDNARAALERAEVLLETVAQTCPDFPYPPHEAQGTQS
ncbi:MAG TPA: HEPN domain-containing protein [Phycisphaerae bacterium]|nr:HEPN domain-containing protein [Phycisphaerae bacterium]HNU46437.1 HEPN domain-containing protein [Phycisphaerae bacterium]